MRPLSLLAKVPAIRPIIHRLPQIDNSLDHVCTVANVYNHTALRFFTSFLIKQHPAVDFEKLHTHALQNKTRIIVHRQSQQLALC